MIHGFRKFISIIVIVLIASFLFFGYNYTKIHLESLVSDFLEKNFNTSIIVGHVGIGFPLFLRLEDVKIDTLIDIRNIQVYPNPASFLLRDNIIISSVKIVNPVVRVEKGDVRNFNISNFLREKKRRISSNRKRWNFYFSRIRIYNGTFIYSRGKDVLEFVNIKGDIENPGICFSKGNICQFAMAGFLKNKNSDFLSPLRIDGFMEPDSVIRAKLQANDLKLSNLGIIYTKYFSQFIEGKADLKSDIKISKRYMVAKCLIKGKDVVLKKKEGKKLNVPVVISFILLVNFKNRLVKIKYLEGNFIDLILPLK